MNISNNSGPNIELWGIPWQTSDHLPYEEPTLDKSIKIVPT